MDMMPEPQLEVDVDGTQQGRSALTPRLRWIRHGPSPRRSTTRETAVTDSRRGAQLPVPLQAHDRRPDPQIHTAASA